MNQTQIKTLAFLLYLILTLSCNNAKNENKTKVSEAELSNVTFDKDVLRQITDSIHSGFYPNMHSILIYNAGQIVYEDYFEGKDETWGKKLGNVKFDKNTLHDVRSVSKSVVSACIGIAIDQGKIESVHQNIFDFFDDYRQLGDELKNNLTIYDLLTMTSGLDWDESVPIDNTESLLEESSDKVAFVLNRKAIDEPGKIWNYSGGNTELLAQIIKRTTGKDVYQFAKENIFDKIGIQNSYWTNYPDTTIPAAASGLRLTTRGMLNFGLVYLRDGKWEDEQIISSSWAKESLKTSVIRNASSENGQGYGYQFWSWEQPFNGETIHLAVAHGNGGQQIYIDTKNDIIIVFTAGNYNNWTLKNDTFSIFKKLYEGFK